MSIENKLVEMRSCEGSSDKHLARALHLAPFPDSSHWSIEARADACDWSKRDTFSVRPVQLGFGGNICSKAVLRSQMAQAKALLLRYLLDYF
ncbi:hypothetical protein CEXT_466201 [Caerostris extrusa]|uniref:Uncharacterized protein n=1 Tax=Caerostris extrusa TaxID=172846 RepID=A0AAV4WTM2_CAEEX|nr:hypothetical protein CEXT_466201 [Caerostris extrusa]